MPDWQKAKEVTDFNSYFNPSFVNTKLPPPPPISPILIDNQLLNIRHNQTVADMVEKGLCPITGKKGLDTTITIRKWRSFLNSFSVQKLEIPVSNEGKKIHHKNLGTVWEVIDNVGGFFIYIPLLGGFVILFLFLMGFTYCLPIWLILDFSLGKKVFGFGKIRLDSNSNPYLTN